MSESKQDLMRNALKQIKQLKRQLSAYENAVNEPIAIIGMGCKYPNGANSPDTFWQKLMDGEDCICQQENNERWDMDEFFDPDPDVPGKLYSKGLGIIDGPDEFDAEFFGISPREVEDIDPQHRILLEVCHATIESAGYGASQLSGTKTGVYVGMASSDYAHLGSMIGRAEDLTPWQGIGNAMSAAPGRISYLFNFKGPALAMDTACSSSLVALHTACQALRQKECDTALTGGVHLVLNPAVSIVFAKARMLAADGLCKTFDADADGYVRSEGCGMVMLKRLSDAIKDRDNILALVKGSAINQDGKSQGITAPNEAAQEDVIRAAIESARLNPEDISYVEAHGTGTPLGDPIELNALHAVYCNKPSRIKPLLVGSVKTNIGHCEAASGIAGIIKMVRALQNKTIPPHINYRTPNPYVPWQNMAIKVTDQTVPWEEYASSEGKLRTGISSFAFTGTNAHVILENYLPDVDGEEVNKESLAEEEWIPSLVLTSAIRPLAVDQWRDAMRSHMDVQPQLSLREIARTTTAGRDHYKYRVAWLPESKEEFFELLGAKRSDKMLQGECNRSGYKTAFVFPDSADSLATLSETFYKKIPLFRSNKEEVDQCLKELDIEEPLSENLKLFGFQYALAKMWNAWGIKADCLMGQGIGETTAACIAGVFNVKEACQIITLRDKKRPKKEFESIKFKTPRQRIFSSKTGEHIGSQMATPDYWAVQSTYSGQQQAAYENILKQNINLVFEVGTDNRLLLDFAKRVNADELHLQPSLKSGEDGLTALTRTLAELYVFGLDLNWQKIIATKSCPPVQLPTYGFQRKSFWNKRLREYYQRRNLPTAVKQWLYHFRWKATENPKAPQNKMGNWLLMFPTFSQNEKFAAAINDTGAELRQIQFSCDTDTVELVSEQYQETVSAHTDTIQLIETFLSQATVDNPVHLVLGVAELTEITNYQPLTMLLLAIAKTVLPMQHIQLHIITKNGTSASVSSQSLIQTSQGMIHGITKSLMLEMPDKMTTLTDIEVADDESLAACYERIVNRSQEPLLALRNQEEGKTWLSPSLQRMEVDALKPSETKLNPDAFYLIAGGTGSLGLLVATWLVNNGARHIALLSRNGLQSEIAKTQVEKHRANGVQVVIPKVNIADREALSTVLQSLRKDRAIAGVFHTAGKFEITPISQLSAQSCFELMDNKVLGIQWLDELTEQDKLDYFVGFSSIAAAWGSAGNFHYSGANQAVDAVIQRRRQLGKPGIVINWGPWADSGMVSQASQQQAEKRGLKTMPSDQAMQVFDTLLAANQSQTVVVDVDWQRFKPLMSITPMGTVFDNISDNEQAHVSHEVELNEEDLAFKASLAQCEPEEREQALVEYLKTQLGKALQLMADEVDEHQPLLDMGIDSLMAVEFKSRVTQVTNIELPIVRLLGGANLRDVAHWMAENYNQSEGTTQNEATEEALVVEGVL